MCFRVLWKSIFKPGFGLVIDNSAKCQSFQTKGPLLIDKKTKHFCFLFVQGKNKNKK